MPLARFYATHRAALPPVFRAIQIAPVWRAERPQKGRYRQFVQCDIDIIGEAGPLAELELLTATVATLDALGLGGCTIRLNDRRILAGILGSWGVPAELRERALITIDKLDKIGTAGVAAELRELGIVTGDTDVAAELEALTAADWQLPMAPRFPPRGSTRRRTPNCSPCAPPCRMPRSSSIPRSSAEWATTRGRSSRSRTPT